MRITTRDPRRWRLRFALMPRKIGLTWVWLEQYWERWVPGPMWPTFGRWEREVVKWVELGGERVMVQPS